jgi:hypothetical protein
MYCFFYENKKPKRLAQTRYVHGKAFQGRGILEQIVTIKVTLKIKATCEIEKIKDNLTDATMHEVA